MAFAIGRIGPVRAVVRRDYVRLADTSRGSSSLDLGVIIPFFFLSYFFLIGVLGFCDFLLGT
jgi:hypothetical protein